MCKVAIVYSTAGGTTEDVAYKIKEMIGEAKIFEVRRMGFSQLQPYDFLIFGTATTGYGDMMGDWKNMVRYFDTLDFTGKKVALYGMGNGYDFGDSFAGGLGQLYDVLKDRVEIVGAVPTDGYTYTESEAIRDGMFVGLPLDEVNDFDLTEARLTKWLEDLKKYF